MPYFRFGGLEYYGLDWDQMKRSEPDTVLIYRVFNDDGSMLAYRGAMQKLDRTEDILRKMRKNMLSTNDPFFWQLWQVGRIIQVAIDRAVGKRIRLSTDWWKVSTRRKKR